MSTVGKMIRMDMAVCRKAMIILTVSMLLAGICCLFFFTPLLLGLFVVGSTAVVSAIFSVEAKSNMEFFYGCFPVRRWEYIVGRGATCLFVIAIPSVISIIFIQIGMHASLCQFEEVRMIMDMAEQYQMLIISSMIMLGFIAGANLLLASFAGKLESRELFEVILLLIEAVLISIIVFLIQKLLYRGKDMQEFLTTFLQWALDHELLSCILLISAGIIVLAVGIGISIKIKPKA